jgi:hypothetical protein
VVHNVCHRCPEIVDSSAPCTVIIRQTINALLEFAELSLSCWRCISAFSRTQQTSAMPFFIFHLSDEDPQVGVANFNLSIPPIVEACKRLIVQTTI